MMLKARPPGGTWQVCASASRRWHTRSPCRRAQHPPAPHSSSRWHRAPAVGVAIRVRGSPIPTCPPSAPLASQHLADAGAAPHWHRVPLCPQPPSALLTLLPVRHGLLALPEHAEEAVGAVGVPAAILSRGARGQAQPEVLVAEVPVGAGGGRAARCHLRGEGGDTARQGMKEQQGAKTLFAHYEEKPDWVWCGCVLG